MREKDIEHKLVTAVKRCGGAAVKFISPGLDGMPDCMAANWVLWN